MRRFVSSVLVVLCLSVSAMAKAEVKFWTANELQETGKLIHIGMGYRDTSMKPFGSAEKALAGLKEGMGKKNIENAYITFEGEQLTKNRWGVDGYYHVAEATAFEFLEPTADNMKKILGGEHVSSYECKIIFAKLINSDFAQDFAPYLMGLVKSSKQIAGNSELINLTITTYCQIAKQGAVEELRKLLKYHSNLNIKLAAGKNLIALGDRQSVENFVDNSAVKDPYFVEELTKVLMN